MTTPKYLLDTNIISELVVRPRGVVAAKIVEVGEGNVCTSIIVSSELKYGVVKRNSDKLKHQLYTILSALTILSLEVPVDEFYADVRHDLQKRGMIIGPNDLLIAAHSLSLGMIMVTANETEFSRVPNLVVENWLS